MPLKRFVIKRSQSPKLFELIDHQHQALASGSIEQQFEGQKE